MTDHILGVDISKANLDVHLMPTGETQQFANSTAGFRTRPCTNAATLLRQKNDEDYRGAAMTPPYPISMRALDMGLSKAAGCPSQPAAPPGGGSGGFFYPKAAR